MIPRLTHAAILILCASASAQFVTSPPGFLNKEGNTNATFSLGSYPEGRFMYADGHHRGKAMTLKGTAYRPGNYAYTTSTGMGRRWSNVTLRMSDCDLATFNNVFSTNITSTPTLVFSSAVTWQTLNGKPGQFPANWTMDFPFSRNWTYSGTSDICLDYDFNGGTLANGSAWGTTTSRRYYKDCHNYPTSVRVTSIPLGYAGANVGCNDRGVTHVNGASITSSITLYSADYPTASLRSTLTFTQDGRDFPPSRPATTFVGLRSSPTGLALPGIGCNNVHIDFSLPTFTIPSFSNTNGSLIRTSLNTSNPGLKGVEIVTQVLWFDSRNRQPLLSNAAVLPVPDQPPAMPTAVVYYYNGTNRTGFPTNNRTYQPVRRYRR